MAEILFNKEIEKIPLSPDELFDHYIENDDSPRFILIVPTGKQVKLFNQRFVKKYFVKTGKPVIKPEILTLNGLVQYFFKNMTQFDDLTFISEAFQLELFDQAIRKIESRYFFKNISQYKPISRNLLERIFKIIYGLKEDGITVAKMQKEYDEKIDEIKNIDRFYDILEIYKNYQKLIKNKYLDYPESLNVLNKELSYDSEKQQQLFQSVINIEIINNVLSNKDLILFYGFSEFKVPELEFLNHLVKSNINIIINLDYNIKNGPIFGNLEDAISSFKVGSYSSKVILKHESEQQNFLRNNLFDAELKSNNYSEHLFKKSDLFKNNYKIIAAKDKNDEINAIAKLVKHLIVNESIKPYDICIASRRADTYSAGFRQAFKKHKIPANISDRFSLESSGPIMAILDVLELYANGFKLKNIIKVIKSPFLKLETDEFVINDKENLEKVLYRVVSNDIYYAKLDTTIKILNLRLNNHNERLNLLKEHQAADKNDIRNIKNKISDITLALEDLKTLKSIFDIDVNNPINFNKMSLLDFSEFIKEYIVKKFKIKQKIQFDFKKLQEESSNLSKIDYFNKLEDIEKQSRAVKAFEALLNEMTFLLKERYGNYNPSLKEMLNNLKTSVSAEKYQILEKENYGVAITSIEQTRGFDHKIMILCGAIDGELPLSYSPEKFLGKELKDSETRHFNSERMMFYQFLTTGNVIDKKYYFFYPKTEDENELVRSQFIDSLTFIANLDEELDLTDKSKQPYWYKAITAESELHSFIKSSELAKEQNKDKSIEKFILDFKEYNSQVQLENLNEHADKRVPKKHDHIFSVSELETYADCPYKYFVSKMLYLDEKGKEGDFIDPIESGNIMHWILLNFYLELQKEQSSLNPQEIIPEYKTDGLRHFQMVELKPNKKGYYLEKLLNIAEKEFEDLKESSIYFELELKEYFGSNEKPGRLEYWLDNELDRIEKGWGFKPALFEIGFNKDLEIEAIQLDSFKLKGKIDRIEFYNDESGIKFMIADYKSSKSGISSNKEIEEGAKFQMPLYVAATKKFLEQYYGIEAQNIGAVYYIFKIIDKNQYNFVLLVDDDTFPKELKPTQGSTTQLLKGMISNEEVIENAIKNAEKLTTDIEKGIINIEPRKDNICEYCTYQSICRIGELK